MPHVLIVDDNHDIRRTVRWVLALAADDVEYVVAEAAHGQQALDILRAGRDPTVVLVDLFMPVMDGQQLLRHILADAPLSALLEAHDIPVLAKAYDIDGLLAVVAATADKLPV